MIKVAVLAGSKSDEKIVKQATDVLRDMGIEHDIQVLSAHRNPFSLDSYINEMSSVKVYIAVAGMAAHLAGAVAARTLTPVIGIPTSSSPLNGLDALLSTSQMPPGVPVATMAIDGGTNGGFYAVQILATNDEPLRKKLEQWRGERSYSSKASTVALNNFCRRENLD